MKKIIFAMTLSLLLKSFLMAQQPAFMQLDKHTFSYGKQKGSLHEFEKYFSNDEKKKSYFAKFNFARKAQRGWNYAGITVGGLTTIVTLVGFSESDLGGDFLPIPFILGAVSGGVVSGIGNWIFGCRKLRYKNKLLNFEKNGHSSVDPEMIHFGVSQNGVGVFYAF